MKLVVTEALRNLAQQHRIFTAGPDNIWPLGSALIIGDEATIEPYSHLLGGLVIPRRFGAFSYTYSPFDGFTSIGRYCSISWQVKIMGSKHPSEWATTHPFSHLPQTLRGIRAYLAEVDALPFQLVHFDQGALDITIGNDVWIGAEVMIKRGVTIGDGAVIGTRSLVTKDVPPYAVVAGSPARLICYRFEEQLVADLQASQWWRYGPDVLQALDVREPAAFLDRLHEREARGDIKPLAFEPLTAKALIEASAVETVSPTEP